MKLMLISFYYHKPDPADNLKKKMQDIPKHIPKRNVLKTQYASQNQD